MNAPFPPRVSLITLGVRDLDRARRFYARLGWQEAPSSQEAVAFFNLNGVGLSLFSREALAGDAGVDVSGSGFSGIALAQNHRSEADVDAALAAAERAGGRIARPAEKTFWGGYSGYFADPDGHLWEIAHNPFFPLDDEDRVHIP